MAKPQFLEIIKQQELKTRKTVEGDKVTHQIAIGDNHALIVMFDKDAKCSGIKPGAMKATLRMAWASGTSADAVHLGSLRPCSLRVPRRPVGAAVLSASSPRAARPSR